MKKLLLFASCLLVAGCWSQKPAGYQAYGVINGAGSAGVHTVLPGETVHKIAENYQLPMREIITVNNIQAPFVLTAGYRLKLPPPNNHTVRKNDSVFTIAKLYEVSVNRLVALNKLQPPYQLRVGQVLRLPTPTQEQKIVEQNRVKEIERQSPTQNTARVGTVQRETLSSPQQIEPAVQTQNQPAVQTQEVSVASRQPLPETTPKASGSGKYMRPVNGRIISSFGPKADGLHNDGINIKASRGTPVRAAENGVVVYAGDDLEGYGNLILLRHEGKMMTAYAHLDKMLVKRGATIKRGESIGTVGKTGQVDTPQLHFEVRQGSKPLNPAKYL